MTVAGAHDYEEVFRDVFPRLVSLGVLKTGRVDSARDLAQETMLRAHTRWDELATYDAPAGGADTVMTNLLVDHHRSATSGAARSSNASAGTANSGRSKRRRHRNPCARSMERDRRVAP